MSIHYAQPILLIEFEENKSFNLQTIFDSRSQGSASINNPPGGRKPGETSDPKADTIDPHSLQSKLVLLTLTFPRLRIIWSSSPHATVDIIADLKVNHPEPDAEKAIIVGSEEGEGGGDLGTGGEGVSALYNQVPNEMLRTIPGISSRNWKLVAGRVGSIADLCEVEGDVEEGDSEETKRKKGIERMAEVVGGAEAGKQTWEFIHKDVRTR